MNRTEEKIKLLKEVGMYASASLLEEKKAVEDEIKALSDLKFKAITNDEIFNKILGQHFRIQLRSIIYSVIFFGIIVYDFFSYPTGKGLGICFLSTVIGLCFSAIRTAVLEASDLLIANKRIEDWDKNIPYGAALAIKEAKERGLDNLSIYYCFKVKDPVIVHTFPKGSMVEIFSWDDGIIYE